MSKQHMSREQRNAILTYRRISEAVVAVVNQTPGGARADRLYEPVGPYLSRPEFEDMLRLLCEVRWIAAGSGDRYFPKGA
jgi:hypothetical protein